MKILSENRAVVNEVAVEFDRRYDENDQLQVEVGIDRVYGYNGRQHLVRLPLADAVQLAWAIINEDLRQREQELPEFSIEDDYPTYQVPGAIWS